ncbi:MAG: LiaF transmembrane domain-containing protein [Acutalibacteraceae bacterium]
MKKISKVLWGIVLISVGVIFALNAFGITAIELFFDGWWTLFIIVPCFIGIFTERDKIGNIIGLAVGVFLLLCCQDVLGFDTLWKLAVPAIIVIVGLKLIFGAVFGDKAIKLLESSKQSGENIKIGCATFSGQDLNFAGEEFNGAELTAVFGGVKCDLRNAVIEKDCAITATSVFGGIDIFMPDYVNVKINSNSVFGGVSDKNHRPAVQGAVTVYINATCMFGGVEIK